MAETEYPDSLQEAERLLKAALPFRLEHAYDSARFAEFNARLAFIRFRLGDTLAVRPYYSAALPYMQRLDSLTQIRLLRWSGTAAALEADTSLALTLYARSAALAKRRGKIAEMEKSLRCLVSVLSGSASIRLHTGEDYTAPIFVGLMFFTNLIIGAAVLYLMRR